MISCSSFSYYTCRYMCLLLVVALSHLCLSTQNMDHVLCIERERQALLQLKRGLIDETDQLGSWIGDKSDCCRWVGIACDNVTGHVNRIHLRALDGHCYDDYNEASKQRLKGNLSSSLLHLKQLRHLDLSCNDFGKIKVPKFIGSLGNLRYLNLSNSNFSGIIPPQLGNLSELHSLCLGSFYNHYESTSMMNMKSLSSLRVLHHLDMSGMDLHEITDWLQVINTLPSLVELHMSNCKLLNINPNIASLNLTSLSLLDLSENDFSSSLPWWIFSITSLVSLDLSECNFHSPIPKSSAYSFPNLTSLRSLYVSQNDFMNSSLVLKGLSSGIGGNLITLDMGSCGISSSVLDSLHNLTSLFSLDLSQNSIDGPIPDFIGRLSFLRTLDLSKNQIYGLIPFSIGQLLSLEVLDLSFNQLNGSLPHSIGHLSSLEVLDLSCIQLDGSLPHSIGRLSSLKKLYLSLNQLNGNLPDSIGQLSSLEVLSLSYNQLDGSFPYWIEQLSSLEVLDLSHNQLNGSLPQSIGRLSSLRELSLSNNQLEGNLPDSLGQLSKLEELDISSNLLKGVVTQTHFVKLVSLKYLDGGGNNLILRVSNWIPPFQLEELKLSSWGLGPQFPLWLQSQSDLKTLQISKTGITSPMPPESFWRSLPNLLDLDMSHNHIHGALDFSSTLPALVVLNLSSNEFFGNLPYLSNGLFSLDLSNNYFEGSLHHLLCSNGVRTNYLILGHNHLSGVIPECWEKWSGLILLNLENNNLTGAIPTTLGSLSNLEILNMDGNKLSGRLPPSLMNLTYLEVLQLRGNELVGSIPTWVGTQLSLLRLVDLKSNSFNGNIPQEICYLTYIQILELANNNLSGQIPKCFNNFSVLSGKESTSIDQFKFQTMDAHDVISSDSLVMKGREDTYSTNLPLVLLLDFSNNSLSGNIPSELTTLKALQSLNLSSNHLTGRIPEMIGDMKALVSCDISLNKLYGELPMSLSSLSLLSSFNVSYNSLTGRIPSSTQLQTLKETSFFGNKLCGAPLDESCIKSKPPDTDNEQEEDNVSHGADWALLLSMKFGFIVGFWVIVAPLMVSRSYRIIYFRFLIELRYMVYDVTHKYCFNMFSK